MRVQSPESRVQSPESRVQSPESRVQSPESRVQSPESRVQSPESRVQSPESRVQSPESRVQSPESRVPESRVQSPESRVQSPESRVERCLFNRKTILEDHVFIPFNPEFGFPLLVLVLLCGKVVLSQTSYAVGDKTQKIPLDNLVQGRLYVLDYQGVLGSQYLDEDWLTGDIQLLNKEYRNLLLRYDIFADILLFLYQSDKGFQKIQLNRDYLQSFRLEDRHFVNLDYSRYVDSGLEKGYYEVAFEGENTNLLFKKRLEAETQEAITSFFRKDRRYLILDGKAHRVRNKKSLRLALNNRFKKELFGFIKKQKIILRKASDAEWIQIARNINTLLQSN